MTDPVPEPQAAVPVTRGQPAPPLNDGSRNLNPIGIGFWQLLKEDYRTYERDLTELGLWAIWTHRFGNWRMGVRPKLLRLPLSLLYKFLYYFITWFWGIKLDYTVQVGRRVRFSWMLFARCRLTCT